MKEMIESKKSKIPKIIINNDLTQYDNTVLFPDKLKEANEAIEKYGIPEAWKNENAMNKNENAFWIMGILSKADAENNTFIVVVETNSSRTNYTITAISETLNKLVKDYWGNSINVHIKPKTPRGKQSLYELIDVQIN